MVKIQAWLSDPIIVDTCRDLPTFESVAITHPVALQLLSRQYWTVSRGRGEVAVTVKKVYERNIRYLFKGLRDPRKQKSRRSWPNLQGLDHHDQYPPHISSLPPLSTEQDPIILLARSVDWTHQITAIPTIFDSTTSRHLCSRDHVLVIWPQRFIQTPLTAHLSVFAMSGSQDTFSRSGFLITSCLPVRHLAVYNFMGNRRFAEDHSDHSITKTHIR
ncbi:hypothetical protein SISNIDRAFT_532515 [Sistotremastrum niveocremeum HHB9708]|uniref:Uncharacterized protein n=1 Tax=Sistotremastrum niveocremeum HHB9708 TaxID=1314777 RepID=A0A164P013_9AGAM|nr:hypothetical protein SISNIDRAFT_532515 [Sistotremastrum niveocremeum HHB9708]